MKNIIVFGTGDNSRRFVETIDWTQVKIIEFWDNNNVSIPCTQPSPALHFLQGYIIKKPYSGISKNVDKIVIASSYYDEIYKQLTKELHIPEELISNLYWYEKECLCADLAKSHDNEKREIYNFLCRHELDMYNYYWYEKYRNMDIQIEFDKKLNMTYVVHGSHRIYMNKKLKSEHLVRSFYTTVFAEQDQESPHCYCNFFPKNVTVDLLIDCGCAEGGFALNHVACARKLMLIDGDEGWSEANKATFAKYHDKIIIENCFLGNPANKGYQSLNNLMKKHKIGAIQSLVIKLDVEGFEESVLEGVSELTRCIPNIVIMACSYHHYSAEYNIRQILMAQGLEVYTSKGYMFFSVQIEKQLEAMTRNEIQIGEAELRRGLTVGIKGFPHKQ